MFPGYAQTYHEQQYTSKPTTIVSQQNIPTINRVPSTSTKDNQYDNNPADNDTINLSIRSSEKVNIFALDIQNCDQTSEPFQVDESMIAYDT